MLTLPDIRLATLGDAPAIAEMSRDCIEHGLSWRWTAARVREAIREPATNVAVALRRDVVAGFGIMHYADESAHLALFAVSPTHRHQHLGARLLAWLEQSARLAGIAQIDLEARADNRSALAFYARQGYDTRHTVRGYYEGIVDAVQLRKTLRPAGART